MINWGSIAISPEVALLIALMTTIGGAFGGWLVAKVNAKSAIQIALAKAQLELEAAKVSAEPAVTAAVNAAIDQVVKMQATAIARLGTQVDAQAQRLERQSLRIERQDQNLLLMRDRLDRQNEYIIDLTTIMVNAGLEVPKRPHFTDNDFHLGRAVDRTHGKKRNEA